MQSTESTDPKTPNTTKQEASVEPAVSKTSSTTKQEASVEPVDVNAKSLAQLNTLMEESLQIYELEDQKTNVIDDLHNALQVITEFLGFSTTVHPGIFNLPSDAAITMLPNLKLIITLVNGKTETKKFSDYPPEVISEIVEHVTPQLLKLIKVQKSYLTEKITFLRTATKQLNTLSQLKENLPTSAGSEKGEEN